MGRSLVSPVVCTFTTPRGSFGATTAPNPPVVAGPNDPGTAPSGTPGSTDPAAAAGFAYHTPGDLLPQDKGRGRVGDRKIYLPGIIYPVKLLPGPDRKPAGRHAHMNSQIWGYGGGGYNDHGAAGGTECDARNYDPMQQRDTFCEVRSWDMPLCPAGAGHQGQDIRPPACDDNKWDVVAMVDGTITQVTSNTTVRLKGGDGTEYYYLHMHPDSIKVEEGQQVKQGQVLGRISNFMNGARDTTHHLHLQVRQSITIGGSVQRIYVPVFASLIAAYRRSKGLDAGVDEKGNLIIDPALEIGAPPVDPASKPPFTTWPVNNLAGQDGRPITPVNLALAFRPTDDKAKVTFAATGLPAGLSLDPATGVINGSLDGRASRGGTGGVYTVTATATAKGTPSGTSNGSFTITVKSSAPIVATPTPSKTFREGDPVLISTGSAFTDPSLNTLTYTATGLPNGLTFDGATGRISGSPAQGAATAVADGVYAVTVVANDGQGGSASESFTLTVLPLQRPTPPAVPAPVITGAIPQANAFAGTDIALETAAYFKPAPGDTGALQFSATGLPAGLSIDAATGQIKGALGLSAADGGGQYPIVVAATNAAGSKASQSFLLTVRNQPPAVGTQTVNKSYAEGETVLIVAGGAFNAPPSSVLTYTAAGLPAGVTIDPAKGTISGTLAKGTTGGGAAGLYTVSVTATDQRGQFAAETFTIKVGPPLLPPVAIQAIAPITIKDGDPFPALNVSSSFKPGGGPGNTGPLLYSAMGLPQGLAIDAQSGIISGTIGANASQGAPAGNYLVNVSVRDAGNGLSATMGFVLTVAAQPGTTPPVSTPPSSPGTTPPPATPASEQGWWAWTRDKISGLWGWWGSKK